MQGWRTLSSSSFIRHTADTAQLPTSCLQFAAHPGTATSRACRSDADSLRCSWCSELWCSDMAPGCGCPASRWVDRQPFKVRDCSSGGTGAGTGGGSTGGAATVPPCAKRLGSRKRAIYASSSSGGQQRQRLARTTVRPKTCSTVHLTLPCNRDRGMCSVDRHGDQRLAARDAGAAFALTRRSRELAAGSRVRKLNQMRMQLGIRSAEQPINGRQRRHRHPAPSARPLSARRAVQCEERSTLLCSQTVAQQLGSSLASQCGQCGLAAWGDQPLAAAGGCCSRCLLGCWHLCLCIPSGVVPERPAKL